MSLPAPRFWAVRSHRGRSEPLDPNEEYVVSAGEHDSVCREYVAEIDALKRFPSANAPQAHYLFGERMATQPWVESMFPFQEVAYLVGQMWYSLIAGKVGDREESRKMFEKVLAWSLAHEKKP